MKKHRIHFMSFVSAVGVFAYTFLAGWFLFNGEGIFGRVNDFRGVAMILILLILSVVVVGLLMFGKPVMLYFDGKKQESVKLMLATLGWFALFGIIYMILLGISTIK